MPLLDIILTLYILVCISNKQQIWTLLLNELNKMAGDECRRYPYDIKDVTEEEKQKMPTSVRSTLRDSTYFIFLLNNFFHWVI